jgi:hypothetical protein
MVGVHAHQRKGGSHWTIYGVLLIGNFGDKEAAQARSLWLLGRDRGTRIYAVTWLRGQEMGGRKRVA